MCGIYKITNKINGKSYIGQSVNILRRWRIHRALAFDPNQKGYEYPLYRAIRKYGLENFSFEVLEECDQKELDKKEQEYILFYNSFGDGYNQNEGGTSCSHMQKLSEEDISEIYDLLANSSLSQKDIANLYKVGMDVISTINNGKTRYHEGINYPIRQNKISDNYCLRCQKKISTTARYCRDCYAYLSRKVIRPSKEELYSFLVANKGNFTLAGKKYGVSANSIKKWCQKYNLPFHSIDYKPIVIKQVAPAPKAVAKIDKETLEILATYPSIYEAEQCTGVFHISDVCNGKRKTAGGFIWKFIDINNS